MSTGKSTLEELLAEILRREKNSLEIISKLEEIYSSKNDSIIIEYTLNDGSQEELQVPSQGFLLQEIQRINDNIKQITGLDTLRSANIKLPDGSIRKIITSEVPIEPKEVKVIGKPIFFHKTTNKAIDKLLDPLPQVKFDLTGKITPEISKVYVKKVILNVDTPQAIDLFNTQLNGANITYNDLISLLNDNGITSDEYNEIFEFPPRDPKYVGVFDVQNIFKRDVTETIDNIEVTSKKEVFRLNRLLYTDLENDESDVIIKKNDELIVNSDIRDTVFKVRTVDVSNNEITLNRVQGYRNITVGTNKLLINPGFINKFELGVTINVNEYMVVFFKPMNPNMGTINTSWGDGVGLYTNDLIDFDDKANNKKFIQFYDEFVDDSGANLSALSNEGMIPLRDAITPSSPTLNVDDFKVVQINTHKEDLKSTNDLRKKFSEKNKTKKNIEKLDSAIERQKTVVATGDFKNDKEKENAQKELDDFIVERKSEVEQYNTLINDIIARSNDLGDFSPKYRVRGFWNIPDPQYKDSENKTGAQEIVQFAFQYRYLRKDNTSTESDSFEFTKTTEIPQVSLTDTPQVTEEKQKATYSKWTQIETTRRNKTIVKETKVLPTTENENNTVVVPVTTFMEENANDPDQININQLEIPISSNENVEIRVKSISEAGYPHSQSAWSDSIIIEFPEELVDEIDTIGSEANDEQLRARFLQELSAAGLDEHLSNSIEVGGDIFDHSAKRIATSFKTPENKPIDVDQKLIDQQAQIDALNAIISGAIAEMSVSITDDNGVEIEKISNNSTINIFAGYYNEITASATVPKGEIVSKLYYIEISNISDVILELLSYVPGLKTEVLPITEPSDPNYTSDYEGFIINKEEYRNYRRFWRTPLSLRAITLDNTEFKNFHNAINYNKPFVEIPTFQSGQVKGQLLYSRNRDVSLNNKLYDGTGGTGLTFLPDQSIGTQETFIWNESETITTPNGNGNATNFCVHIDHPDLDVNSDFIDDFSNNWNGTTKVPTKTVDTTAGVPNNVYYPQFSHSKYFNLQTSDVDGELQLDYIPYEPVDSGATTSNFPRKIGFSVNDKFLVGSQTCGSYLFLAPSLHKDLHTGSIIFNSGVKINKGDQNKIRIPLLYQFRMTDYYGAGSTGAGVIGGFGSPPLRNLTYAKKIGLDIQIKNQDLFSFDIRVESQYKPKSIGDVAVRQSGSTTL